MSSRQEEKDARRRERLARAEADQAAERRRRIRQLVLVGVVAVTVVVAAIIISQTGQKGSNTQSLAAASREVERQFAGIPQSGITLGKPDAPATVMEFADLQCPYCGGFAREVLPGVIDRYLRSGRVKLEFHTVSILGPDSELAARAAAAAAQQNRIWQYTELFYRNQQVENSGYVNNDFLRRIADATPGLDVQRAVAQRDSPGSVRLVQDSAAEATRLGVNSTPTFFVRKGGGRPQQLPLRQLTPAEFTSALGSALGSR